MCEATAVAQFMGAGLNSLAIANEASANRTQLLDQSAAERAKGADALQRGASEAGQIRTEGTKLIGENKASLAASGVDVQSGSAIQALAGVRQGSEVDVQTVRSNAARAAWGHTMRAQALEQEAENISENMKYGIIGSFLGGAGRAAKSGG